MPEGQTSAAFEEVLQLSVDTDSFSAQMDQVVAIYSAALEKMPEMGGLADSGLSDSLERLEGVLQSFAEAGKESLSQFSDVVDSAFGSIQSDVSSAAEAIQNASSRIVDAFDEIRSAQADTAESSSEGASNLSGFVGGVVGSAAQMAKVVVLYRALSEALNLVLEGITAPFKAVSEGFHYLSDVQERASLVKAALLQSVSYSAAWGENVRIAGEQADQLVQKIDDIAVKLKVSSQSVQTGFSSFLEYGGRNLTGSVDEALQVSSLVTGALQTQRPNLDSRTLIAEMQKLAQGAATDTDKLAAALGLSKQQLAEMVQHAQKYHDLYQEILAFAPGIADRISEANDRQSSLVATLKLYQERWGALIAGPLFQQFTTILQGILKYVDENGDKLNQIGRDLGKALGDAAIAAEHFIKANWTEVVFALKAVAVVAIEIAKHVNDIVSGISLAVSLARGAKDLVTGHPKNALNDVTQPVKDSYAVDDNLTRVEKDIWNIGKTPPQPSSQPAPPDNPLPNRHPKTENGFDSLRAYQQELRDEITKTDGAYKQQTDAIHDALAKNTINHQQAANQIKSLSQQEPAFQS